MLSEDTKSTCALVDSIQIPERPSRSWPDITPAPAGTPFVTSNHAVSRALERSSLSPASLEDILNNKEYFPLKSHPSGRGYCLVFDIKAAAHLVAVYDITTNVVVTVLPLDYYESWRGESVPLSAKNLAAIARVSTIAKANRLKSVTSEPFKTVHERLRSSSYATSWPSTYKEGTWVALRHLRTLVDAAGLDLWEKPWSIVLRNSQYPRMELRLRVSRYFFQPVIANALMASGARAWLAHEDLTWEHLVGAMTSQSEFWDWFLARLKDRPSKVAEDFDTVFVSSDELEDEHLINVTEALLAAIT